MSLDLQKYEAFLKNKVRMAESHGLPCDLEEINPALKLHNKPGLFDAEGIDDDLPEEMEEVA
jgi:hypothetical protein